MKISEFKKDNYKIFITNYLLKHKDEVFTTRDLEKVCKDNNFNITFNQIRHFAELEIERTKDADGKIWYGCSEAIGKIEKLFKGGK